MSFQTTDAWMCEQEQISYHQLTEGTESFFASPFPPVKFWGSVLLEGEDLFPIVLHADHSPAVLLRFIVEFLGEGADLGLGQPMSGTVGVFAFRIVVQDEHRAPRAAAGLGVFEHLSVAGRVAERRERPASERPLG